MCSVPSLYGGVTICPRFAVYVTTVLAITLFSYLGPTGQIPFGDVMHYTAVEGVYLWARVFVNQVGFFHTLCPTEPRSSYFPQIFDALVVAVRFIDGLTDMAFFRVLLHKVCTTDAMQL